MQCRVHQYAVFVDIRAWTMATDTGVGAHEPLELLRPQTRIAAAARGLKREERFRGNWIAAEA